MEPIIAIDRAADGRRSKGQTTEGAEGTGEFAAAFLPPELAAPPIGFPTPPPPPPPQRRSEGTEATDGLAADTTGKEFANASAAAAAGKGEPQPQSTPQVARDFVADPVQSANFVPRAGDPPNAVAGPGGPVDAPVPTPALPVFGQGAEFPVEIDTPAAREIARPVPTPTDGHDRTRSTAAIADPLPTPAGTTAEKPSSGPAAATVHLGEPSPFVVRATLVPQDMPSESAGAARTAVATPDQPSVTVAGRPLPESDIAKRAVGRPDPMPEGAPSVATPDATPERPSPEPPHDAAQPPQIASRHDFGPGVTLIAAMTYRLGSGSAQGVAADILTAGQTEPTFALLARPDQILSDRGGTGAVHPAGESTIAAANPRVGVIGADPYPTSKPLAVATDGRLEGLAQLKPAQDTLADTTPIPLTAMHGATPTAANADDRPATVHLSLPEALSHGLARAAAHHADRQIEVVLSPDELGRVRMHMTTQDGGLTMNLQADRPETLELLRRHIETLAQDFRDLGFRDLNFSFGRQDSAPERRAARDEATEFDNGPRTESRPAAASGNLVRAASAAGGLDLRV